MKIASIIILFVLLAPAAGPASVVTSTCTESVIIWQNAPAVGLPGSYADVVTLVTVHHEYELPIMVTYHYENTLRNGNAVYRAVAPSWPGLMIATARSATGTIYAATGVPLGGVGEGATFAITCDAVWLPVVVR